MDNSADTLRDEYRRRFARTGRYRNEVWKILCAGYFNALIAPQARVLDLGSGWGEFINNITAAGKCAMDLNPDAEQRLAGGTCFLRQDCAQAWQLPADSLDVVFTSNLFEHLPDRESLASTLAEAGRCLKDGGLLICLGPNVKYVRGAYWDFWDHRIPLTDCSLAELLELTGFSIQVQIPRFLPYSMSTGATPLLFLVKLYLKLPVLWPLFGKQFLVIGRKRPRFSQGELPRKP